MAENSLRKLRSKFAESFPETERNYDRQTFNNFYKNTLIELGKDRESIEGLFSKMGELPSFSPFNQTLAYLANSSGRSFVDRQEYLSQGGRNRDLHGLNPIPYRKNGRIGYRYAVSDIQKNNPQQAELLSTLDARGKLLSDNFSFADRKDIYRNVIQKLKLPTTKALKKAHDQAGALGVKIQRYLTSRYMGLHNMPFSLSKDDYAYLGSLSPEERANFLQRNINKAKNIQSDLKRTMQQTLQKMRTAKLEKPNSKENDLEKLQKEIAELKKQNQILQQQLPNQSRDELSVAYPFMDYSRSARVKQFLKQFIQEVRDDYRYFMDLIQPAYIRSKARFFGRENLKSKNLEQDPDGIKSFESVLNRNVNVLDFPPMSRSILLAHGRNDQFFETAEFYQEHGIDPQVFNKIRPITVMKENHLDNGKIEYRPEKVYPANKILKKYPELTDKLYDIYLDRNSDRNLNLGKKQELAQKVLSDNSISDFNSVSSSPIVSQALQRVSDEIFKAGLGGSFGGFIRLNENERNVIKNLSLGQRQQFIDLASRRASKMRKQYQKLAKSQEKAPQRNVPRQVILTKAVRNR